MKGHFCHKDRQIKSGGSLYLVTSVAILSSHKCTVSLQTSDALTSMLQNRKKGVLKSHRVRVIFMPIIYHMWLVYLVSVMVHAKPVG